MSIYKSWLNKVNQEFTQEEDDAFWKEYLSKEETNYKTILSSKNTIIKGKLSEVAEKFEMDSVTFSGFLDGINTSFESEINLDDLTEETELDSVIVWNKLFFNMLKAKADWLYEIEAWNDILSIEERKIIRKDFNKSKIIVNDNKIGRNEPCPCGSGKKYKKCCINK